jgi:hypothetical protein
MDLQGTNVAAGIVPFTDQDRYATHFAKYGKGGRMTGISSISERDAIPVERRELFMEVPVEADVWTLKNGLTNADWEKASLHDNIRMATTTNPLQESIDNPGVLILTE